MSYAAGETCTVTECCLTEHYQLLQSMKEQDYDIGLFHKEPQYSGLVA